MNLAIAVVLLAGFLWLIGSALRGAWAAEQRYKAAETARVAVGMQPTPTPARRWLEMAGMVAALLAVYWLVAVAHVSITAACVLVAVPVLLARQFKAARR